MTIQLIDRPEVPSTGVSDSHCNPLPAAVGSAVFDAIGVRMRALPMRAEAVKKAMA